MVLDALCEQPLTCKLRAIAFYIGCSIQDKGEKHFYEHFLCASSDFIVNKLNLFCEFVSTYLLLNFKSTFYAYEKVNVCDLLLY